MTEGSNELRNELTRVSCPAADARLDALDLQIREVLALKQKYSHGIELYQRCPQGIDERNCFMFALGIEPDEVRDWCLGRHIFPGKEFVRFLIDRGILIQSGSPDLAVDGAVVIYFSVDGPEHAGKWSAKTVISKWGAGRTHIWRHPMFEVPREYGDTIKFFDPLVNPVAHYREWAIAQALKSKS